MFIFRNFISKCGDIIQVERDTQFPCDMLLLYSKAETENCHIQTANLDGETNLKVILSKLKL